jgi:hypothetical protein
MDGWTRVVSKKNRQDANKNTRQKNKTETKAQVPRGPWRRANAAPVSRTRNRTLGDFMPATMRVAARVATRATTRSATFVPDLSSAADFPPMATATTAAVAPAGEPEAKASWKSVLLGQAQASQVTSAQVMLGSYRSLSQKTTAAVVPAAVVAPTTDDDEPICETTADEQYTNETIRETDAHGSAADDSETYMIPYKPVRHNAGDVLQTPSNGADTPPRSHDHGSPIKDRLTSRE